MMNKIPTKFEKSLIFIVVILCIAILIGYWIYEQKNIVIEGDAIHGELLYLSNISDPNDCSVGIWIEIILYKPTYIKYGDSYFLIILRYSKFKTIVVDINNSIIKKDNLTIVHEDLNNDSFISSQDRFHIYGEVLINSTIEFCVKGYWLGIRTYIGATYTSWDIYCLFPDCRYHTSDGMIIHDQ